MQFASNKSNLLMAPYLFALWVCCRLFSLVHKEQSQMTPSFIRCKMLHHCWKFGGSRCAALMKVDISSNAEWMCYIEMVPLWITSKHLS